MKISKYHRIYVFWIILSLVAHAGFSQTSRNIGLTGGPDGDYAGFPMSGVFNLTFNNVPGTNPTTTTPLPGGSLQIVIAVPPGIEVGDNYTPPAGWTYTKSGASTAVLVQTGPVSSSPPASFVVFAIPLNIKAAVDEGVWSAQIQRVLPTYQDPDPTNNTPAGTVSVADNDLPVILGDFTASREGSAVKIDWYTTLEVNSAYFEIQHSREAQNWKALAREASHQNSKDRNYYNYTHMMPASGINYYRLKMVDLDGSFTYSNIKSIRMNGVAAEVVKIYPNPVSTGLLTIESAGGVAVKQVEIINGAGIRLYAVPAGKGAVTTLPVYNYPAGVYTTRLVYEDGSVSAHRVIVAK